MFLVPFLPTSEHLQALWAICRVLSQARLRRWLEKATWLVRKVTVLAEPGFSFLDHICLRGWL